MSLTALVLIIIAAFIHAGWNFFAKKVSSAGHGGQAFVILTSLCTLLVYAVPVAWLIWQYPPRWSPIVGWMLLASALTHLGYSLCLQRGYQVGDLSVVYPLARGTGPLISTVGAIVLFKEAFTGLTLLGAGLVVLGVFVVAGGTQLLAKLGKVRGVGYGLLTGVWIAAYTLIDAYSVTVLLLLPMVLDYVSIALRLAILLPFSLPQAAVRESIRNLWREHKKMLLLIGAIMPISYILVLTAMQTAPVSHIAPARELSMLVAAYLGAKVLNEGESKRRNLAAVLIVVGVMCLAWGR